MKLFALALALFPMIALSAPANKAPAAPAAPTAPIAQPAPAPATPVTMDQDALDELDPYSPDIEEELHKLDEYYKAETGMSPIVPESISELLDIGTGCYRETCAVWARVSKKEQRLYLMVNGQLIGTYKTSTGLGRRGTPNFDKHPDGRIYTNYTSRKFPGGNYVTVINGKKVSLGNMPYAVFIRGGFAIHGTGVGNWKKLGQPASHGCIRVHPDNARLFNAFVRQYGIGNTWITVH